MRKKEQGQRAMLASRLFANGVPLKIDRDEENPGVLMRQIGAVLENCAFDLKYGGAGFIVSMSITITQHAFTIADIFLKLHWTEHGLSLVEDPLEGASLYGNYGFPGNPTLAFPREAVMNHFVNVRRLLPCGKTIQGLLLWVGSAPIPLAFVHGATFPATVTVVDQYENRYPYEVTLLADRSERGAREKLEEKIKAKKVSPRLLDQRDPVQV